MKATDAQTASREAAAKTASKFAYASAKTVALMAPPWSLVVAAGGVATGATIDLVRAVFHGRRNRKQVVAMAAAAGFPQAAEVPAFTARALRMKPDKLTRTADKLVRKIGKGHNRKGKNETRLQILHAVAQIKNAAAVGAEPVPSPAAEAAAQAEMDPSALVSDPVLTDLGEDTTSNVPLIAGGVALAGLLIVGALALRSHRR
jgi:hypothetical protein